MGLQHLQARSAARRRVWPIFVSIPADDRLPQGIYNALQGRLGGWLRHGAQYRRQTTVSVVGLEADA